jgi:hypothetical protein
VAHTGRRNADEALALAMASGQTLRKAAAAAGVSERTAARRVADPTFRRRISELRGEMVHRSLGLMTDGMCAAAERLRDLLDARNESVCLGAARSMLELGIKLRELVELTEDLKELRTAVEGIMANRLPVVDEVSCQGDTPPSVDRRP